MPETEITDDRLHEVVAAYCQSHGRDCQRSPLHMCKGNLSRAVLAARVKARNAEAELAKRNA